MNFRIGSYSVRTLDAYNLELVEHYMSKPSNVAGKEHPGGVERENRIGYYGTIESALNALINRFLRDNESITTAKELLDEMKKLKKAFLAAVTQELQEQEPNTK